MTMKEFLDKWLKKYDVTIDEFPKFSNEELKHWLNRYYNGYSETPHDLDFILDIQIDFYCYAAMVEAKKMIDFLESKRTNANKASSNIENSDETENTNQLTVNQAVILLDKLGVFSDKAFFCKPLLESTKSIASSILAFLIKMVALVSGFISLSKIKLMPVARDKASNTTLILASRSSNVTGLSNGGFKTGGVTLTALSC